VEITEWATGGGLLSKQPAHPVKATFKGSLVRIDDMRILDNTPGDNAAAWPALGEHGLLMANFIAVHTFFLVRIEREALTLLAIDDAWVDGAIRARTPSIPHEHIGEDPNPHEGGETDAHQPKASDEQNWVLLTAPSSQLRALVRHHGKAGLFSERDPGVFVRVLPVQPRAPETVTTERRSPHSSR